MTMSCRICSHNKKLDIEKVRYGEYAPRGWAKLMRGEETAQKVRKILNK